MSKQRSINTKFWSDTWVREGMNPLDRYLFLYFLTNEHTNLSGIYELSLSQIAFETGLDREELARSMLPKLNPKVIYEKGWIILPNFPKHQNQKSPKIQAGIIRELESIPENIKEIAKGYGYSIDTLSHLTLTKPNSNLTKPNLTLESTPAQEANDFFLNKEKQESIKTYLIEKGISENIAQKEIEKFVLYWTEPNSTGRKLRWQKEKVFDVKRRFVTWMDRAGTFSKQTKGITI